MENLPLNEKPPLVDKSSFLIDFGIGFLAWFVFHGTGWAIIDGIAPSLIPDGIGLLFLCFLMPLPLNIIVLLALVYKRQVTIAYGVIMAILINSMGTTILLLLKHRGDEIFQYFGLMYPFFLLIFER
jgi:hypothetical protein